MLNNISQEKLSVGNSKIFLENKNILGDFCIKRQMKSLNMLNITTVRDSEGTDTTQSKYITPEEAIAIAKRENQNKIK